MAVQVVLNIVIHHLDPEQAALVRIEIRTGILLAYRHTDLSLLSLLLLLL